MRIVDAKNQNDAAAIASGRKVLEAEIANPSLSLMIVRGESTEVSHFVDRASARCDPFPWRQGVWVRKAFILSAKRAKLFAGHDDACAVILDLQDRPAQWLVADAELFEIETAWSLAEGQP